MSKNGGKSGIKWNPVFQDPRLEEGFGFENQDEIDDGVENDFDPDNAPNVDGGNIPDAKVVPGYVGINDDGFYDDSDEISDYKKIIYNQLEGEKDLFLSNDSDSYRFSNNGQNYEAFTGFDHQDLLIRNEQGEDLDSEELKDLAEAISRTYDQRLAQDSAETSHADKMLGGPSSSMDVKDGRSQFPESTVRVPSPSPHTTAYEQLSAVNAKVAEGNKGGGR